MNTISNNESHDVSFRLTLRVKDDVFIQTQDYHQ